MPTKPTSTLPGVARYLTSFVLSLSKGRREEENLPFCRSGPCPRNQLQIQNKNRQWLPSI
jgi:hypothetical protein